MNNHGTILIVDDEIVSQAILQELLTNQGYTLVFAKNGPEALEKAATVFPDIVLLDVMLPHISGFEVCRQLRANPKLAKVPIILLTALNDRASRLKGFEAGADDFISKPFDLIEFRVRVRNLIQFNRYRSLLADHDRFEWMVGYSDKGYVTLDSDGNVVYLNPKAYDFLELPPDKLLPDNLIFLDLVQTIYRCEPEVAWENWPNVSDTSTLRYLIKPESYTEYTQWLQVDLLKMSTSLAGNYLVRLHDVTTTIQSDRIVWTFHGQISHKLNTPLGQLMAGLESLKTNFDTLSKKEMSQLIDIAHSGAADFHREVNAIFEYLSAAEMKNGLSNGCNLADIQSLITEICQALHLVDVQMSPLDTTISSSCRVTISDKAIELVLREILQNAKKFHPQSAPSIEVEFACSAEELKIQISDDGLVLSPHQLSKIWTPYYQVEKCFSGQTSGMGLGLSMVASLIWDVGGSFRAFNREDSNGLVIELRLPRPALPE